MLATCVNVDRDDHFWFTDTGAEIWVWDIPNEVVIYRHDALQDNCGWTNLTFTPDNRSLAVTGDEEIQIWQVDTWEKEQLEGNSDVAFSADGGMIAFSTSRDSVSLRSYPDQSIISEFPIERHGIHDLEFSPDGNLLAAANTYEGMIYVWDILNQKLLYKFSEANASSNVAFSSDGRWLLFGSDDPGENDDIGHVQMWDMSDGLLVVSKTLGENVRPYSVDFSPDDTLIAIGTNDEAMIFSVEALWE